MEIVKKNLFSIICGVVALICVALVFYPLGGMFEKVKSRVSDSSAQFSKIKSLRSRQHLLPVTDPEHPEQKPLDQFPTEAVTKEGVRIVEDLHKQSEALVKTALEINRHQPLTPDALPSGQGAALSRFKAAYYNAMENLKKQMNAIAPPNLVEVQLEGERIKKEVFEPRIDPSRVNEQQVLQDLAAVQATLPRKMMMERAKNYSVYVASNQALDFYERIPPVAEGAMPNLVDVWAAQLSFWIQQDIAGAVAATNNWKNKTGVPPGVADSVVKRIVKITIPKEYVRRTGKVAITAQAGFGANPAQQAAPPADELATGPVTPAFNVSATGRVSNNLYDVLHFTVIVEADAAEFPVFMNNLTKNKFITILKADIPKTVDSEARQNSRLLYGPRPVITLRLRCEAIFFRSWTKPLMPMEVRRLLGIPDEPPAGPVAQQ